MAVKTISGVLAAATWCRQCYCTSIYADGVGWLACADVYGTNGLFHKLHDSSSTSAVVSLISLKQTPVFLVEYLENVQLGKITVLMLLLCMKLFYSEFGRTNYNKFHYIVIQILKYQSYSCFTEEIIHEEFSLKPFCEKNLFKHSLNFNIFSDEWKKITLAIHFEVPIYKHSSPTSKTQ